ncbi:MAG: 50S ribosomal protein L17 [Planctomycetes bacterium]|nr:50S ribosomal protein L17 [Planctomycetota bacterium]
MRHRVSGKHLGRTPSHRRAMRRNMAFSLFEHGAIRTTEVKAKELRRFVEKLITTARKGTLHARRRVIAELQNHEIVDEEGDPTGQTIVAKLFDEIAPRYAGRPGGYTRMIRLPDRRIGDAGKQVLIQLVEEEASSEGDQTPGSPRRRKKASRRIAAAEQAATPAEGTAEEASDELETDAAQEEQDMAGQSEDAVQ